MNPIQGLKAIRFQGQVAIEKAKLPKAKLPEDIQMTEWETRPDIVTINVSEPDDPQKDSIFALPLILNQVPFLWKPSKDEDFMRANDQPETGSMDGVVSSITQGKPLKFEPPPPAQPAEEDTPYVEPKIKPPGFFPSV